MRTIFLILISSSLFFLACNSESAKTPDLIIHNGKIYTVDQEKKISEAISITDGLITSVGSSEDILTAKGQDRRY